LRAENTVILLEFFLWWAAFDVVGGGHKTRPLIRKAACSLVIGTLITVKGALSTPPAIK
jgi:hypothetical protein